VVGFSPVVVGMNSIAIYCMSQLMKPWIRQSCSFIFGQQIFDGIYGPIVSATAVLFVLWLICYWLYDRKSSFGIKSQPSTAQSTTQASLTCWRCVLISKVLI